MFLFAFSGHREVSLLIWVCFITSEKPLTGALSWHWLAKGCRRVIRLDREWSCHRARWSVQTLVLEIGACLNYSPTQRPAVYPSLIPAPLPITPPWEEPAVVSHNHYRKSIRNTLLIMNAHCRSSISGAAAAWVVIIIPYEGIGDASVFISQNLLMQTTCQGCGVHMHKSKKQTYSSSCRAGREDEARKNKNHQGSGSFQIEAFIIDV